MPVTTGMKGAGYYDQHSTAQLASIQLVLDWIDNAIAEMSLPPASQPFTALDLGSSEGRNALIVMDNVAESVRKRQPEQLIQTIYSDLPSNNFNRLFTNLHEARAGGYRSSRVYPSAVAGSFYESLVPPSSLHFATACNALLWLDHLPSAPVPDAIVYRRPNPPRPDRTMPPETIDAFTRQAEQDLIHFLQARALELAPGGKLLIVSPGDDDRGSTSDGLYDVLNDACLDLIAAGRLERQCYERFVMPLYFRTLEETLAPLDRADSPVKDAFRVDRAETLEVPTPFLVEYDRTGDANALAHACMGFLRAFSEPVARAALVGTEGDPAFLDVLYGRVHARLQAEPNRYRFRYVLTATLFTRC
jgi:gibberellin A4 carboxyl methyltransferase